MFHSENTNTLKKLFVVLNETRQKSQTFAKSYSIMNDLLALKYDKKIEPFKRLNIPKINFNGETKALNKCIF